MKILFRYLQIGLILYCSCLVGCAGEPFDYQADHELKPGPGLLSGKDGEFTLLGKPRSEISSKEVINQEQQKEAQKTN